MESWGARFCNHISSITNCASSNPLQRSAGVSAPDRHFARLGNTYVYTLWYEAFESSLSPDATMCLTHSKETYFLVRKEVGKEGWMAITCFDGERPSWAHEDCRSNSRKLSAALAALHIYQVSHLSLAITRIKSFCPFSLLVRGWELTGRNKACIHSALQHPPAPAAVGGSP